MKKRRFLEKIFIIGTIILLSLVFGVPRVTAQFGPFYNPSPGFGFFGYAPFFLPPPPPLATPAPFRYAHTITPTLPLFPAPILPTVPAVTAGGVGVTTLIPTVPITVSVPVSALITTPLAPLITYTPLSLVGLTYAPVPVI